MKSNRVTAAIISGKEERTMQTTFAEALETVEELTVDEKETLIDILQRRIRFADYI